MIIKHSNTSNIIRFTIKNSSTGIGLTGLTEASAGLIISTICNNEATATTYTQAGSTIETIAALGTYAAPTATKCRFKEVDATNHKGLYEFQIADARYAIASARSMTISVTGAASLLDADYEIQLVSFDPHDSIRMGMTSLPNAAADGAGGLPISDAGGLDLDTKLANTNEVTSARMGALTDWINGGRLDLLLAAIPTTAMRGTDNAALASGVDLTSIHGVALTETVNGYLAAAFVKLFDVVTPVLTTESVNQSANNNTILAHADYGNAKLARTGADSDTLETLSDQIDLVATTSEYDEDLEDIRTLLGDGGNIFYVSKTGDNSDGTTWAKAMTTIDAAIALCTANHCDRIYIGCGTYDETSATAGVACDVAGIKIIGAMPGVIVNNTNTTNGSKVFYITANNVWLHNMKVEKGETTSDNAIDIDVDGSYVSADLRDVTIAVEKATHTGIRFTGGAVGCGYANGPMGLSYIYSAAGVGTGIEAANCNNCVAIGAQLHTLTTGIKFTGGANCHDNMVSPYAMISSCTTGISLTAGCVNNMLSASILNCTDEYDDNSGNNTNKADGSLTYVLDDIKTHVDNGFDGVEGAGFDTLTDSLEAIRNRGDAEWITATGFSTHNAAAVKTAIEAAGSYIAQIKAKTDGLPSGIAKNIALGAFTFYMVLTSDHVSAATGKTLTGQISKDGGAFTGLTNSITEIGNGLYKIDIIQAEMNADVVTLKFTETDCDQRVLAIYTS